MIPILDPINHVYTLNGIRLSGVTELIEWARLLNGSEWWAEEARQRGTAVHECIHFINTGGLDWDSVDPRVAPYVKGYEKFVRETQFEPMEVVYDGEIKPFSELTLACSDLGLAGTIDLAGNLNAMPHIVDFKSGPYAPWQAVQLELYRILTIISANELGIEAPQRVAVVQLTSEGDYKIHTPKKENRRWAQSMAEALASIAQTRWKIRRAA